MKKTDVRGRVDFKLQFQQRRYPISETPRRERPERRKEIRAKKIIPRLKKKRDRCNRSRGRRGKSKNTSEGAEVPRGKKAPARGEKEEKQPK